MIVCSTAAAERVQRLAGPAVQVIIDDRALDPRAIEMLAAILVRQERRQRHRRLRAPTGALETPAIQGLKRAAGGA